MQRMNFGRIENIAVRGGEPQLTAETRVLRSVKFGSDNGPRHELASGDFPLRTQHVELFALFDDLRDGTVARLDIKGGIPISVLVEEVASE